MATVEIIDSESSTVEVTEVAETLILDINDGVVVEVEVTTDVETEIIVIDGIGPTGPTAITVSATAPADPAPYELWLDISGA